MNILKYLLLATLLVIFPNGSYQAADKLVCYYASWANLRSGNGKFTPEDIDANLCTHINYAFLGLNQNGTLKILDEETDVHQNGFKRVSDLKKVNPKLKVLFSIGGAAADTGVFTTVASDAQKRANMAQSALELCKMYDFDGLDVDWEYPRGGDLAKFIDLLTDLKNVLKPHGHLVTVAVNSIPGEVGGYDIPAMSKVLDFINVMTYDFHSIWGETAQNSPLYGGDYESNWVRENRNGNASITYWLQGGAAPEKLIIGAGFYGHTYTLSNPSVHKTGSPSAGPGHPGPYTANMGSLGYNEICELHGKGETVFENDTKVPYLHDGTFWTGFDNGESLMWKANYAKEKGLGGVMVWSIDTDDLHGFCGESNGLLKALHKHLLE